MRCIGYLDTEEAAQTLRDFLYVEGIGGQVEHDDDHGWALWIAHEDQLEAAAVWLARFRDNPHDPVFKSKARNATALREQAEKTDAAYARKLKDRRQVFRPMLLRGAGPLTLVLLGICVAVALVRLTGPGMEFTWTWLSFSNLPTGMPEIRHGQFWRLLTPIFVHAPLLGGLGFLHLLFNALWLRDLGGMIETRQGTTRLLMLVLGLGVISNAVQYFAGMGLLQLAEMGVPASVAQSMRLVGEALGGPGFGGMSGVNYGLFGYIWMRSRFDPGSGLFLMPQTVSIMLIWFVLCFTPIIGNIANGAHLGGLVAGMVWGWLASQRYR
jgi:GlpG protein